MSTRHSKTRVMKRGKKTARKTTRKTMRSKRRTQHRKMRGGFTYDELVAHLGGPAQLVHGGLITPLEDNKITWTAYFRDDERDVYDRAVENLNRNRVQQLNNFRRVRRQLPEAEGGDIQMGLAVTFNTEDVDVEQIDALIAQIWREHEEAQPPNNNAAE